jgi:hypothetical protein
VVLAEVVVLAVNGWRCPLTGVAARYTDDRRENFDIDLPLWLARHNKRIFGALVCRRPRLHAGAVAGTDGMTAFACEPGPPAFRRA